MNAMAIDLGGTHANCAIVRDRQVLRSQVIRISGTGKLAAELPTLGETLKNLAAAEGLSLHDFTGIAIGFCGLVHRDEGRVLSTNSKYEDAPDLDLPAWTATHLELPLSLENDARLALLGEWYAGAARVATMSQWSPSAPASVAQP
jgi:glucokinase